MVKDLTRKIADRNAWPDSQLRWLSGQIDAELARRAANNNNSEDELEALERQLTAEARRYQRSGGIIRG